MHCCVSDFSPILISLALTFRRKEIRELDGIAGSELFDKHC